MKAPTGIGLMYNIALDPYFDLYPDTIDYVELTPDILIQDKGPGEPQRFGRAPKEWETVRNLAARWPMVAHHVGFSLGTAHYFDEEYLDNVIALQEEFGFHWHSDHLSYSKLVDTDQPEYNTCLALPVPYDSESLDMLVQKTKYIRSRIDIPFFVENNVYFAEIPDEEFKEGAFIKALCRRGDCGFLLDLHNVYVNAVNFNFDAIAFIDTLDLELVEEIHIAGGDEIGGMRMDSHSGPCPEEVWTLLDYVLPRAPRLRGVTFEVDESYLPVIGFESVAQQLRRARALWDLHKTPQHVA